MDFAVRDKIQDYGDNLPFHPHSELYRSLMLPESIPRVGREPKKAFLMNLEEDTELWYQKTSISGQIRWERGIAYSLCDDTVMLDLREKSHGHTAQKV